VQGDGPHQKAIRAQRDTSWSKLDRYWRPIESGGQDMTLNRMPDSVKINLVNEMARGPAEWTAMTTIAKTETKVSTARHEFAKNPRKKRKVRTRTHTNAHVLEPPND
jgi:hypothetical protein